MLPIIEAIGYTDEGTFEVTVRALAPDGTQWYSKAITTQIPISLIELEMLLNNTRSVVARKFMEFTTFEHSQVNDD